MSGLPASAPVVIIGAGCIGTSIAYELGRRGVKGVVVVEKEQFAGAGSTSKAAGGIRAQFSTPLNVRLSMMSIARFKVFAEEMDTDPVYFPVGYLFLLGDDGVLGHVPAAGRDAALARAAGADADPRRARRRSCPS